LIFAYADEKIPEEYSKCRGYSQDLPFAFACLLSAEKSDGEIEIDFEGENFSSIKPIEFLDYLRVSQNGRK
jgi:hypothetical protein